MNREDIIRMAREAGWDAHHAEFDTRIQDFAALVAAAEREVCAKVCEAADKSTHPADLADAIRARGNT